MGGRAERLATEHPVPQSGPTLQELKPGAGARGSAPPLASHRLAVLT